MGWRMTNDHNLPTDPVEDPELDALIATAGRFPAQTDFEHQVIRVVALPLPGWAVRVRTFKTAIIGSRAGKLALAGLGVGLVTSVTVIANWLRVNGQPVGDSMRWLGERFGLATGRLSLRAAFDATVGFLTSVLPASVTNPRFVGAALTVVAVSAVGLYVTAGPPALRSRHAR